MSTFSYNTNIPAANNDPADDQPLMQTNYSSISQLIDVDHVAFNTAGGGRHDQVTFAANNAQGAQTDPVSVAFTQNGTAAAHPQLLWKNSLATFQLSCVRAWGFFDGTGGFPLTPPAQSYNVTSITNVGQPSTANYVVTLTSGAVSSANFAVVVSCQVQQNFSTGSIIGWSAPAFGVGVGSFQINSRALTAAVGNPSPLIAFVVLQI